jgi:hypothetical protein
MNTKKKQPVTLPVTSPSALAMSGTTSRSAPERHYSGPSSTAFWDRVAALEGSEEWHAAYFAGVLLQEFENRVLRYLEQSEAAPTRRDVSAPPAPDPAETIGRATAATTAARAAYPAAFGAKSRGARVQKSVSKNKSKR